MAAVLTLAVQAGMTAWGYVASVDLPPDPVPPQASVLYYKDGRTVLARVGTADRTDVPLAKIPPDVRHAFLAAEDRDFYSHSGLSVRGVVRALWANVANGDGQGASTITQQYVRNAYLTQNRSLTRKTMEAALALKIEHRLSKDDILERYLNTIYFGRNAYGIQSAAQAYFGTTVDRLTGAQGAVLAALIKDPWMNDPAVDAPRAKDRWRWILRAMAEQGWLDAAAAEAMTYPRVAGQSVTANAIGGPLGLIADRVEAELSDLGIDPQVLRTGGLHVVTTIDATAQRAAMASIGKALRGQPKNLRAALVAVDPDTGGVRAYYGGDRGRGFFDDAVAPRPAASTFKPIALAAGEEEGIAYSSLWDGSSPRTFTDRQGVPLRNRKDMQCPACPLDVAMVHSLNTPFYALAERIGPHRIRDMAVALGVPQKYGQQRTLVDLPGEPAPGRTRADITLGRYAVAPADLATVYGTFAAGGRRAERHMVESVTGGDGTPWHRHRTTSRQVLGAHVAADVGHVLSGVVAALGGPPGHGAAAKTGSHAWGNTADTSDAWTAGYVSRLAAVTWFGRSEPGPVRDARGRPVNGDGMPYRAWRAFLTAAVAGTADEPLPAPQQYGDPAAGDWRASATLNFSVGAVYTADGSVVAPGRPVSPELLALYPVAQPTRTPEESTRVLEAGAAGPGPTGAPQPPGLDGPDGDDERTDRPGPKQPSATGSPAPPDRDGPVDDGNAVGPVDDGNAVGPVDDGIGVDTGEQTAADSPEDAVG